MRPKHISNASRQQRLQRQRQQRLCPFDEKTTLGELINPQYHALLREAVGRLRPWLPEDIPKDAARLTRLDFDWSREDCTPMNVCRELARFFLRAGGSVADTLGCRRVDDKWVKWRNSEFYRWMASPDHGNLRFSETCLKDLLAKAFREQI